MSVLNLSKRATEKVIGILYILATVSSIIAMIQIQSLLAGESYLTMLYSHRAEFGIAILLQMVNNMSVLFIGILFFGLLRQINHNLSITVLSTRVVECILLSVGSIFLLLLIYQSKLVSGVTVLADISKLQGSLSREANTWSFLQAMISLGIGGTMLSYFFFVTNLVPRVIAIAGIVGYLILFAKSVLEILGYPLSGLFFIPVALFELAFPIWLLVKGLNLTQTGIQK